MKPDNKYCTECSWFSNEHFKFIDKYGRSGCTGIVAASGEFPYGSKPHCFTDKKLLTAKERRNKKIKEIVKIIKTMSPKKAAETIHDTLIRR